MRPFRAQMYTNNINLDTCVDHMTYLPSILGEWISPKMWLLKPQNAWVVLIILERKSSIISLSIMVRIHFYGNCMWFCSSLGSTRSNKLVYLSVKIRLISIKRMLPYKDFTFGFSLTLLKFVMALIWVW